MGELLFWVGEDKMTFGSDYNIWTPKWQVEGLVDWDYPEGHDFDDYPRLGVDGKKKILGLNAAKLYDIEVPGRVPAVLGHQRAGLARRRRAGRGPGGGPGMTAVSDTPSDQPRTVDGVWEALRTVRDPELDTDVVSPGLRRRPARCPTTGSRTCACACPPTSAPRTSRSSWSPTRTTRCRRCRASTDVDVELLDHFASDAINAGVAARAGFVSSMAGSEVGEAVDELARPAPHVHRARAAWPAPTSSSGRSCGRARRRSSVVGDDARATHPPSDDLPRLRARRRELGIPADDDAPLVVDPAGRTVGLDALPLHLRKARSYQVGVDANTSICRGQLAARYGL